MTAPARVLPLPLYVAARGRGVGAGEAQAVTHGLVFDGPHEARAVVELAVAVTATTDAARAAGGV